MLEIILDPGFNGIDLLGLIVVGIVATVNFIKEGRDHV